jgi:hypothetical protein
MIPRLNREKQLNATRRALSAQKSYMRYAGMYAGPVSGVVGIFNAMCGRIS